MAVHFWRQVARPARIRRPGRSRAHLDPRGYDGMGRGDLSMDPGQPRPGDHRAHPAAPANGRPRARGGFPRLQHRTGDASHRAHCGRGRLVSPEPGASAGRAGLQDLRGPRRRRGVEPRHRAPPLDDARRSGHAGGGRVRVLPPRAGQQPPEPPPARLRLRLGPLPGALPRDAARGRRLPVEADSHPGAAHPHPAPPDPLL